MTRTLYDPYSLGLDVAKFSGVEAVCRCIFPDEHKAGDTHPSATFNLETGLYYCFSCGMGLDVEQVARVTGGMIRETMTQFHLIGVKNAPRAPIGQEWRRFLSYPIAIGNEYLHKRGFTDELIKLFDVREGEGFVAFPLINYHGNVIGMTMRNMKSRVRYRTYGSKEYPWGMHQRIDRKRPVWIVEGPFGAVRAIRNGLQAFATNGALVKQSTIDVLSAYECRILFDDDRAGYVGAERLLRKLPMASAVIPGMEADEIDDEMWQLLGSAESFENRPSAARAMAQARS